MLNWLLCTAAPLQEAIARQIWNAGQRQRAASRIRCSLFCLMLIHAAIASSAANEPTPIVQRNLSKIGYDIAAKPCGANAQRSRQRVKNRFDEKVIDQRETIRCGHLVLVVYHAAYFKPPRRILESLILQSAHTRLPKAISPGATRDEVLAYAGGPMQVTPTSIVYLVNNEGPDQETATFHFENGKLVSISWWWSSQ